MQQPILIDGINIICNRNKRLRHISIVIQPFKAPQLNVPLKIPLETALEFLRPRLDWLKKRLEGARKIEKNYDSIAGSLVRLPSRESREKLLNRIKNLAIHHNFTFNKICIRNQRTLWGSCSAKNNININMRLAWLPDELIDYVILHELNHTRVHNHRREFWESLERILPGAAGLKLQLKQYNSVNVSR